MTNAIPFPGPALRSDADGTLVQRFDRELAIESRMLGKRYRRAWALSDVALQVPTGAVSLFVGPNGAGKSTTIRILLDLTRATTGEAMVLGHSASAESTWVRRHVGYVPEQLDWGYGWLTVAQLLTYHSRYYPTWDDAYAQRLSKAFNLQLGQTMRTLSKGQGRRVHLLMALAHRPPVLILDEPTDGLDPLMREGVLETLVEHIAESPTTLLISTHHAYEFEALADHVSVIRHGTLQAQLPMETLRERLRRYQARIPAQWEAPTAVMKALLRRKSAPGEIEYTLWGDETELTAVLEQSGATLWNVSRLNLSDAMIALLDPDDGKQSLRSAQEDSRGIS